MNTQLLEQASVLNIDEQIELAEAIWDGIASRGAAPALTAAQKAELDRRRAGYLANPNDVVSWDEVKATALPKIGLRQVGAKAAFLGGPCIQNKAALTPISC